MKCKLFSSIIIALVLFSFGCTAKQAIDISDMSVDAIILDDAVDTLQIQLTTHIKTLPDAKKQEIEDLLARLDNVQLKVKSIVTMKDPNAVLPMRIAAVYYEAKSVTIDLRKSIYDEADDFVVWKGIPAMEQAQLVMLNDQANQLGMKIESFILSPENMNSLNIAKDVAVYGFLALKILSVASVSL